MRYRSARSRATAFVGAKAVDKSTLGDSHAWKTSKSARMYMRARSQREVRQLLSMGFAGNGVSHLRELRKTLTRGFFLVICTPS